MCTEIQEYVSRGIIRDYKTMKEVILYTDVACSGNPGPGGWGAVLMYQQHTKELSGYEPQTTNNRMEITAVIRGLEALKEACSVEIYTDSAYVFNAFDKRWIQNWRANGWKTSTKRDVENQDLWKRLFALTQKHQVRFHKVKGHADNSYNNRCDELATAMIRKNQAHQKRA